MPRYTPGQLTQWLSTVASRLEADVLRPLARYASTRIGARATSTYMREGSGEAGPNRTPVLRRITGRLTRSLTRAAGGESVNRAEIRGSRMSVTKGSTVPYAGAHEHGFSGTQTVGAHTRKGRPVQAHARHMTVRARPFLTPALADEAPGIAKRGQALITKLFKSVMGGAP